MASLTANIRSLGIARRASLVFALWIGFWLLAIALVACLLYVPYSQLHYNNALGFSGCAAIVAAVSLLIALRPRAKVRGPTQTPPLARERIPALYDLVERIGAQAGVTAPVGIYLRPENNAGISAQRTWYGRIKRLEVCVGYGLICILSEAELGAVVAHEYGHFVGGDLGLGPWVYRVRTSIGRTLGALESSIFLLDWPFRLYANLFLKHSSMISRAQEYAADALAARLFGPEVIRSSLEKTHGLGALWTVYMSHALIPAVNQGAKLPIRDGFTSFLASGIKRANVLEAIEKELLRKPGPFDTHPSLAERVGALGSPTPNHQHVPSGCAMLLGTLDEAEALWFVTFTREKLVKCSWESFGDAVVIPRIQKRFLNTFLCPDRVPLTALATLVNDTEALWLKTKPSGPSLLSPLARDKYVLGVLQDFAIASLFEGWLRLDHQPGEYAVMRRGEAVVRPDQLLPRIREGRVTVADLSALAGAP